MRNRILSITRTSIPYVKELMPIAHSIAGCLLMQQLDWRFESKPNGFYKFLEPCPNPLYRPGDSWSEELGLSAQEFRTTFDKFGIRYKSKAEFEKAPDKFQGKFYCSYHDKRAQLTFYFRNHEALDKALDDLLLAQKRDETPDPDGKNGRIQPYFPVTPVAPVPVTRATQVTGTQPTQVTGNRDGGVTVASASAATVTPDPQAHEVAQRKVMELDERSFSITENKDLQIQQQQRGQEGSLRTAGSSCDFENEVDNLIFPAKIQMAEKETLMDLLIACPHEKRQQVLDELEGYIRADKITSGVIPLARSLFLAVGRGQFLPNHGVAVLAARESALKQEMVKKQITMNGQDISWDNISPETLASLPKVFRDKAAARQRSGNN